MKNASPNRPRFASDRPFFRQPCPIDRQAVATQESDLVTPLEPTCSSLPEALIRGLDRWVEGGAPPVRLLERSLDRDGVPRDWPVNDWWPILERLEQARKARREPWPESVLAILERFFLAALRFSRPGGGSVFDFAASPEPDRAALLKGWAKQVSDPTLAAVVDRWFPRRGARAGIPPLPAFAASDRVLAILRADWNPQGDVLAIDHRRPETCRFSLIGRGQAWLGPVWDGVVSSSRPRPRGWQTGIHADYQEWSFGRGANRRDRLAVLLRGRGMALIAEQGRPSAEIRLPIALGLKPRPIETSRGLILAPAHGGSARVWPIGLPNPATPDDRFDVEGGAIAYSRRFPGKQGWLPLLVSWDSERNRRPVQWRSLTVTENRKACRDDRAVAWRISWGRGETLVIYRSLGRPESRCFLGHQTRSGTRFLMAEFDDDGDFRPLLTVMA